jgi:hypothetical protein
MNSLTSWNRFELCFDLIEKGVEARCVMVPKGVSTLYIPTVITVIHIGYYGDTYRPFILTDWLNLIENGTNIKNGVKVLSSAKVSGSSERFVEGFLE